MDEKQQKISEWLEKLQQESWNLELLISGFSIFLLIQVGDSIDDLSQALGYHFRIEANLTGVAFTFLGILKLAAVVLTCNLVIHVLMRGFWIGAIGLRSVQDKPDIARLNYSSFFAQKLSKNIISLDELLTRLDNLSSVIFSFSFLIIFMLISLFLGFSFLGILAYLSNSIIELTEGTFLSQIVQFIFVLLIFGLFFLGIIYMIDTLSLGFFKKYRWLSRIYYPIYQFFGFITLASIYRGIYYSIISRFPKARIRLLLLIYLSIVFLLPFHKYDQYIFFPDNSHIDEKIHSFYYDDIRGDRWIQSASISSRIIESHFLPLFIKYDVSYNDDIKKQCPDFTPSKQEGIMSGIRFGGGIQFSTPKKNEKEPEKALDCLSRHYNIYLNDSLQTQLDFWFFTHPNKGEKGLMTILDLSASPPGRSSLKITRNTFEINDDSEASIEEDLVTIPFWLNNKVVHK